MTNAGICAGMRFRDSGSGREIFIISAEANTITYENLQSGKQFTIGRGVFESVIMNTYKVVTSNDEQRLF